MNGYTKLFNSLVTSSIWSEDDKTRIVWITMLAMKDMYHRVECTIPGLAALARISIPDCRMAIAKLESPDQYSRTTENEGRRIAPIEGGWLILNGQKYQDLLNIISRRERQRRYMQKKRENEAHQVCDGPNPPKKSNGKPSYVSTPGEQRNIDIQKNWGPDIAADHHPETGRKSPLPKFNPDNAAKCDL